MFLISCSNVRDDFMGEKMEFYKVAVGGNDYYFRYPSSAQINFGSVGKISYKDCVVSFGPVTDEDMQFVPTDTMLDHESKKSGGKVYDAWFDDDKIIIYSATIDEFDYGFWAYNGEEISSFCVRFVDFISDSFGDELVYVNDEFLYSVNLPEDFNVEYLDDGVVLKKWVEVEFDPKMHDKKDFQAGYKVEIVVLPIQDFDKALDLAGYIGKKYPGFTMETAVVNGRTGFFVDESNGSEAIRHFFIMNEKIGIIYEAYMKVPTRNYSDYKLFFDKFAEGVDSL
ncbi:hypothetical protein A3I58_02990 [Candidatus Peregrinibacteria bacterium RIFCSPLOWO2_02_FULL_39_10]|nr:MAG: hypothetical protein A3I58_02990 [Candidatus Peregrinibacteria bacterium RIFCSPLOWO2_02_FULL_39_10]